MFRRRHATSALCVLIVVSISPPPIDAAAPEPAGIVRVRLASPPPVPAGVRVELRAASTPLGWTREIAAPDESALFVQVPPGAYTLIARLPDGREATAIVNVRMATMTDFVVDAGGGGPAGAPSLKQLREEPLDGDVHAFDQTMLATFPADDALAAVVETAVAPLIVDRLSTGGLWLAEPARLGGYGSSWRQASIVLGGLDVTDPVRIGTPLMRPAPDAVDALLVSTTLLPASVGGPGPVVSVVPKAAAAIRYVAAEMAAIPGDLRGANSQPGLPSIARFAMHRDANAQHGAPLGARANLFVAVRHTATDRLERDDAARLRTRVNSLAASATIASETNRRLRLAATVDRAALPYPGRARWRSRTARESDSFLTAQASWDRWTPGGSAWSATLGLAQGVFSPAAGTAGASSSMDDAATIERFVDGPVPTLFESAAGTRRRWTAGADITPSIGRLARRHLPSAGATLAYNAAESRGLPAPLVAELVAGMPARIWEYTYGGAESRWTSTELAAYVTDRLLLHDRVRVDVGVRLEAARGSARGGGTIAWASLSPRVSARWLLQREGRLALFGGYARYAHRLPLDALAYGDPAALAGRVYRWHDLNADRAPQTGERGPLVAFVGPCCTAAGPSRIDPDLKQPQTKELAAGVELRMGGWPLRVQGVYREEHHLLASVNAGVTLDDYALRYIADLGEPFRDPPEERLLPVYDRTPSSFGRDAYVLTNPGAHSASYLGYDLVLEGAIARRLRTRVEGSLYHGLAMGAYRGVGPLENDHGLMGELFENPNALTGARGNTFLDRTYVVKWWARYEAPGQWVATAVARYQDGQPFARLAIVSDLNQGAEGIYGFRPGRSRFTFTGTLDARLEKAIRLGRTRIIGAIEIFNLLNAGEEVEEDVATGPTFRRPTALQPPRAARVALRVVF